MKSRAALIHCLFGITLLLTPVICGTAFAGSEPVTLRPDEVKTVLPAPGPLSAGKALEILRPDVKPPVLVLDVRTVEEFTAGHIPHAVNIPIQELEKRLAELPKDKPILIVCRTGVRAAAAYTVLFKAWPGKKDLWYLAGTPEYTPGGGYTFR